MLIVYCRDIPKYCIIKNGIVIETVDRYTDGAIKIPKEVQIGWTYDIARSFFEPPIPPKGFEYDWQGNRFVPATNNIAEAQNETLDRQDLFLRMSAENIIKETEDLLLSEMIERGIL